MSNNNLQATRDGFGAGLIKAAQANPQIVGLCADLTESMRMTEFEKLFPQRFIQVGVAEQNLIGTAAGLALAGKIPFAASFAVFSPGRSWEQIRGSVAYSNLNVKIVGGHAGVSTGPDGATHQALEDLALMTVLPNMTVVVPADAKQAELATLALAEHTGPAYLRLGRDKTANVTGDQFKLGQAEILRQGNDLSLIACGMMVGQALAAAEVLSQQGLEARVINMHTIKPLDTASILAAARETKAILTLEEHQAIGGLGSLVAQTLMLSDAKKIPFAIIAMPDQFGQSGETAELFEYYGFDVKSVVKKAMRLVKG